MATRRLSGSVARSALAPHVNQGQALETASQRLKEDAEAAEELRNTAKAKNTRRAYQADFNAFVDYCEAVNLDWRRATSKFLAAYLTSMLRREHITVATIKRARSGISAAFRAEVITPNPARGAEVRETLDAICRKLGVAPKKKTALFVRHLVPMLDAAADSVTGKRDRALLSIGFTGAFRRSEIVAINVDDITFNKHGAEINVRRSKTDQHGVGRVVGIPRQDDAKYCPAALLEAWLLAAQITEGAVFRSVRERNGKVTIGEKALTAGVVATIVKEYAAAAKVDPSKVAGHSLRSGAASQMSEDGASAQEIMAQTGHKSLAVMRGYIQRTSVFRNNAMKSIWKRENR